MIPDIPTILAMLVAGECTLERAQGWINIHMENADLRDHFASGALAALIGHEAKDGANCGAQAVPRLAQWAYEYADALLAARKGATP